MLISFQTYRTIKRTLAQVLHTRRASHQEQYLNTLALLVCGIVSAQHVQFAQVAEHAPVGVGKGVALVLSDCEQMTAVGDGVEGSQPG